MNFNIGNPLKNPFIGPILVASIIIVVIIFLIIPKMSQKNEMTKLQNNAVSSINKLKKIRSYYTSNVISKVKNHTELKINYNHKEDDTTIPLPATLLHNLSQILPDNGMSVNMFSNYPFPNRQDRVLDRRKQLFQMGSIRRSLNILMDPYAAPEVTHEALATQELRKITASVGEQEKTYRDRMKELHKRAIRQVPFLAAMYGGMEIMAGAAKAVTFPFKEVAKAAFGRKETVETKVSKEVQGKSFMETTAKATTRSAVVSVPASFNYNGRRADPAIIVRDHISIHSVAYAIPFIIDPFPGPGRSLHFSRPNIAHILTI